MLVKNKGAACFYGSGTKWCITMDSQSYYEQYVSGNVVFIFLLRKDLQQENPSYKVAMAFQRGLNNEILKVQYFNAIDNIISEDEVKNGLSHFTTIKSIAENTAKQEPKGFLAILKTKPETLTLEDYKKNMNEGQSKEIIAKDVNTPPEILAMLAKDGNEHVRQWVASNPNTPPEILAMLAKDGNEHVRQWVASNTNTPPEILAMLAKDGHEHVRQWVASNTNTPPEILAMLAKDGNEDVRTMCSIKYKYTTRNISNVSKRW